MPPLTVRDVVNHITQGDPDSPSWDNVFAVGNQYGHIQTFESLDAIVTVGNTSMAQLNGEQAKFLHEFEPRGFEAEDEPVAKVE